MCLIIADQYGEAKSDAIKSVLDRAYDAGNNMIGGVVNGKPFWGVSLTEARDILDSKTSVVVEMRRRSPAGDQNLIYPTNFWVKEKEDWGFYFQNGQIRGIESNQPHRVAQILSQVSQHQHNDLLNAFSVTTRICTVVNNTISFWGRHSGDEFYWSDHNGWTISNRSYL